MPRKFYFPSIKMYDGTGDPDDHIAQYKQRMLAVALPKESREATMCKGFGSTLIGPALQWYINLPTSRSQEKTSDGLYEILQHRVEPLRDYIARFNQEKVAVPECNIPTAISAFKRGLLPDGGLYKELTMYPCKTMEDVLSRAWAQVKWKESRTKGQPDQIEETEMKDPPKGDPRTLVVETGAELVNALRQMGQQVKWPPKMKAPDSFRNPGLWCDFHRDHGHKTEDCISLRIKVNELLQRGISENSSQRKPRPTSAKRQQGNPKELHQPHHLAKIG
ncbi:PREDICTED: uncharacterized protein LOC106302772 [Brassica oleracea var. oleracea]|uniref:uncharacterized protein LOC106302772 n=1 Tax=Brassica oleracea var. oleracea TaxID=109376 RepID=UPI0006A72526|nr:PREDICTED: uncharacterized protein LOC106302772 [Brassica oleracea var. oleracea]